MELNHSPNDSSSLRKLVYSLDNKILDFAPGTKFNATETYSNSAYDILGYLVQKISGIQYQDYITDSILEKANMPSSFFDYTVIPIDRRSSPHILKGKVVKVGGMYSENVEHSPSANLNSCSIDLCNWMMHNLNIYTIIIIQWCSAEQHFAKYVDSKKCCSSKQKVYQLDLVGGLLILKT
ncbi:MAG: beta-lactamase family protein [Saprospiraceae bacterium]|nr:beta-lactamase family protein [Candidatus Vicinibacter affinis]